MAWRDPEKIPPVIVAVSAERVRWRLDRRRGGGRNAAIVFGVAIDFGNRSSAVVILVGLELLMFVGTTSLLVCRDFPSDFVCNDVVEKAIAS